MTTLDKAFEIFDNNHAVTQSLISSRANQVRTFHEFFECPIAEAPTSDVSHMSDERIGLRLGLIIEEVRELLQDGFGIHVEYNFQTEGQPDTDDVVEAVRGSYHRDVVEAVDALGDISYVCDGFALEMGVNLDEVVDEIHASNMTKLGEDGKPIYRSDGKVLKGPNYLKPDIASVIFKKAE